jgi:hypothetical protein
MRFVFVLCVLIFAAAAIEARAAGLPVPQDSVAAAQPDTAQSRIPQPPKEKTELKKDMASITSPDLGNVPQWEREKSATVAVFSSMLVPGLGQIYNGRKWKAVIFAGLEIWFFTNAMWEKKRADEWLAVRDDQDAGSIEYQEADLLYNFHKENARTFMWWLGGTWLISMLDAFIDAHLFDVRAVDPTVIRKTESDQKHINYIGFEIKW